jgi:hypothetical protein
MLDIDYDYQRTLIDADHYYKTSPYEAKRISTNFKTGEMQVTESWIFSTMKCSNVLPL